MTLHHIATATLCLQVDYWLLAHSCSLFQYSTHFTPPHAFLSCLQSYALGNVKIGSVIMFLHDITHSQYCSYHINTHTIIHLNRYRHYPPHAFLSCLQSYALGYVKIGSVIMFLHDISDIPLDLVRLFGALQVSERVSE